MGERMGNRRWMLGYLATANFVLFFGFRIWQAMFNNFAVEELGVGPASVGWIQAIRELPGLMGFLIGFLALVLSEVRIMALSVVLLGAGTFLAGQAHSIPFLLASTVIMSVGFHWFYPSSNSVVLMLVHKRDAPRLLGHWAPWERLPLWWQPWWSISLRIAWATGPCSRPQGDSWLWRESCSSHSEEPTRDCPRAAE